MPEIAYITRNDGKGALDAWDAPSGKFFKAMPAKEIAEETTEKLKSDTLTKEQKKELAKESTEQLQKHMSEVENILLGRVAANTEDIDLAHIKKILEKYPNDTKTGQMAAKEELMRLPAEKRDAILQQLMAEQAKK